MPHARRPHTTRSRSRAGSRPFAALPPRSAAALLALLPLASCGPSRPRICGGVPAPIVAEAVAPGRTAALARELATAVRVDDRDGAVAAATAAGEQLGVLAHVLTDQTCGRERLRPDWLSEPLATLRAQAVALVLEAHRERYLAAAPAELSAPAPAELPATAYALEAAYLALLDELVWNALDPALTLRETTSASLRPAASPASAAAVARHERIHTAAQRAARRAGNL